jgi:methylenetetrahydrofolate reductase (NADPH)
VAIIPSVIIVRGAGALRYIDEHVPGITVPAGTIERCAAADDQLAACEDVAFELARHAMSLPGVAGLHFISFRRDAGIARLCQRLGIPTREERESVGDRPFVPA